MEAYKAFVCVCLVLHTVAPCVVAQIQLVPALYVFGDSTVDAGNNNYLKTIIKANFPPYGRDFDTHVATGRFCNGRTPADWLSVQLGLPLVPAYLDPAAQGSAIVKGVNFATSASGLYWKTAATFNVPPLETQVEWFREYKERLKGTVGEQNASSIISQALFALSTGSNDYVNNYYINPITQKEFDKDTYRGVLMDSFSEFVQKLYGLGARRIAAVGLTPLGCIPSQVTLYGRGVLKCIEFENQDALLFNRALNSTVRSLRATLSDLKLAYLDVYSLFSDVFDQPSKYGFEETLTGCCGTGRIEVAILCNPKIGACPDATKYVFWDSFHPTDTMNKLIARAALTQGVPQLL